MLLDFKNKIIKIGNSMAVSIPSAYIKNYKLQEGEEYSFTIETDNKKTGDEHEDKTRETE